MVMTQVVMRRDAPPFVFVEEDGASNSDFTGITPAFLKARQRSREGLVWDRPKEINIYLPVQT